MRLLFAVHGYKPAHRMGGPIISVSRLAETLVSKGHQVTVFTTDSNLDQDLAVPLNQPVDVDGVQVWYFQRQEIFKRWTPFIPYLSRSIGFLFAPQMTIELDRLVPNVDLVHTHMPFVYPTYAAARAARWFGKPLFYHQRGVFDPERLKFRSLKKRAYIGAVERRIMRQAVTLIALTDAEVSSYRALGAVKPCRIIPNGIDLASYRSDVDPGTDLRWNIPPGATVILFLARLHPTKGADRLIRAFRLVHSEFPRAVLVMAGPDEWKLQSTFQELLNKSGLSRKVIFTGMLSGKHKTDLLARADLFCLPSLGEGFSVAILEALASSTPVLISPGCHFPEVEHSGVGQISDTEPETLARTLRNLLTRPHDLKAMGQKGPSFVAQKYSWDRIADQMVEAYQEGLQRH